MAQEERTGWAALPTWDEVCPTWSDLGESATRQLSLQIKLASVKASGWAVGKDENTCLREAARRLQAGE